MEHNRPLQSIPDDELLRRLADLLRQSRRVEADLVAHIGEVDERRLYTREASPSMFVYCTEVLHLSGAEAYLRITVARAARTHPVLLRLLEEGRLHLTGIALLAPYLTRENRDQLLKRATHKSKRQVQQLIAEIAPRPDVPAVMRKLPQRGTTPPTLSRDLEGNAASVELRPDGASVRTGCREQSSGADGRAVTPVAEAGSSSAASHNSELFQDGAGSPAPGRRPTVAAKVAAIIEPLSPARYKVQFTASAVLQGKLEQLRALMRPQVPDGDLAAIIEQAVTEKLERLEAKRFAKTKAPRKRLVDTDTSPSSRHIPAAVRRAVSERDGNRCRYVDGQGRRCPERSRLEYHHGQPFALGGDRSLGNISLMCHAHNEYLAEHDYGREAMVRHRHSGNQACVPTAIYGGGESAHLTSRGGAGT